MMKWTALTAMVLFAFWGGEQLHMFGIGGKPILCVQEKDLHADLMAFNHETTQLEPGGGYAPGFSFLFRAEEMQGRFPTYYINPIDPYRPRIDALHGVLGFTSAEDRRRWGPAIRARDVEDIWYARGACPNPVIEPLEGTGYYRVQCEKSSSNAMVRSSRNIMVRASQWSMLWNQAPNPTETMPHPHDIVLATCSYHTPIAGPFKTYNFHDCMRTIIIDEFMIDYEFQEQNAGLIAQFDRFLAEKIAEWRQNCGGTKT